MGEGDSKKDLFPRYNQKKREEIDKELKRLEKGKNLVLIGPPASGKSFFIQNYLQGIKIDEMTLGEIGGKSEEESYESGIKKFFEKIKTLWTEGEIKTTEITDNPELHKKLKETFGEEIEKRLAKRLETLLKNSSLVFYFVSEKDAEIDQPEKIQAFRKALEDLKLKENPIKWFNIAYIPPTLFDVKEGEDPEKVIKERLNALQNITKLLGLERGMTIKDVLGIFSLNTIKEFTSKIAGALASSEIEQIFTSIGKVLSPVIGAVVEGIILLAFSKEEKGFFKILLDTINNWNKLDIGLKRYVSARLALIFDLTPKEVYEALDTLASKQEKLKEIEDRLNKLENELNEVKDRLNKLEEEFKRAIGISANGVYYSVDHLTRATIKNERQKIIVGNLIADFVEPGNYFKEVWRRFVENDENVVVIVGEQGVGKSALAWAVAAEMLHKRIVNVVFDYVNVSEDTRKKVSLEIWKDIPKLFIYDPIESELYSSLSLVSEEEIKIQKLDIVVKQVIRLISQHPNDKKIIVLTQEMYNELQDEEKIRKSLDELNLPEDLADKLRKYLSEAIRIDANKLGKDFLKKIIISYTTAEEKNKEDKGKECDKYSIVETSLLDNLAEKIFQLGTAQTLIARYAGERLRLKVKEHAIDKKCVVDEELIKSIIEDIEAKDKEEKVGNPKVRAVNIMKNLIKKWLKITEANKTNYAEFLVFRRANINGLGKFIPWSAPEFTSGLMREVFNIQGFEDSAVEILSFRKEDLFEEALDEIIRENGIDEEKFTEKFTKTAEWFAEKLIDLLNVSNDEEYKNALTLIGLILLGHSRIPEGLEIRRDSEIVKYLVVGDFIPKLPYVLIHYIIIANMKLLTLNVVENICELDEEVLRNRLRKIEELSYYYVLSILTLSNSGKISEECYKKVMYIISWNVSRIGPQYKISLVTLNEILSRAVRKTTYVIPVISKILNRHREHVDLSNYIRLISSIEEGKELDPVLKAFLASTYAMLSEYDKEYVERAEKLSDEVKILDEDLWLVSAPYIYPILVEGYLILDDLNKAEKALNILKHVSKTLDKKDFESLSQNAKEYLKWMTLKDIKESYIREYTKSEILYYEAEINFGRFVYEGDYERLNEAIVKFKEALSLDMKIYKKNRELSALHNYYASLGYYIRSSLLAVRQSSELKGISNRLLEELRWEGIEDNLRPNSSLLSLISKIFANYVLLLALSGKQDKVKKELEKYNPLLSYDDKARLSLYLFLQLLGYNHNITDKELVDGLQRLHGIRKEFIPALRYAFGLITKEEAITQCVNVSMEGEASSSKIDKLVSDSCIDLVNLVDEENIAKYEWIQKIYGLYERSSNKHGIRPNDLTFFEKLRGRDLVIALSLSNSLGGMLLLFKAIINRNCDLARAIALLFALGSPSFLFADVYHTLKSQADCNLTDELKLKLVKLFFLHF